MPELKFPEVPDHYERVLVLMSNTDYILIARSGHFVTMFYWDGYSPSWYRSDNFQLTDL